MAIIDGHLHVFRAVSEAYPRAVHELFPADLEAPVEDYLATMEAAGVDRAVLVPLSPHDEYLAEVLAAHPGRFAGVGVADPAAADPVADLRRRVEDAGIQGLRVHHLGDPAAADPEALGTFPLLAAMAERDLKLWFYSSPDQLALLPGVLELLPDLPVVLNHLGFCQQGYERDEYGRPRIPTELPPPTLPTVIDLARHPNVNVMVSGQYAFSKEPYPYPDLTEVVRGVYDAYGADRLLWASDYPWIVEEPGYGAQLRLVETYLPEIPPEERAAIMGGTAARLFRFDGGAR